MRRTKTYSFAGAGVGFLVAFAIVWIVFSAQPASDRDAITLFVGIFLAGSGAIAGAIIGGVSDLLEFLKGRDQT